MTEEERDLLILKYYGEWIALERHTRQVLAHEERFPDLYSKALEKASIEDIEFFYANKETNV